MDGLQVAEISHEMRRPGCELDASRLDELGFGAIEVAGSSQIEEISKNA